jgi:hypothetical protein
MANEIMLIIGTSGLAGLYAKTLSGATLGDAIALSEVTGAGGVYVGTMAGLAGEYALLGFDATDALIACSSQSYSWDGAAFTALGDVQETATALADGRFVIDYTASIATQYNADGSARTVFDLLDADGAPATTAQTAVERAPQ